MLICRQNFVRCYRKCLSSDVISRKYSSATTEERILKSSAPKIEDLQRGNFVNTIFKNVDKYWSRTAIECPESKLSFTFSEIADQVSRWSGFLKEFGVTPKDVVTIVAPNCELKRMLDISQSKFIIYSKDVEENISLALKEDINKYHLFCIGKSSKLKAHNVEDILYGKQSVSRLQPSEIVGEETCYIPFSRQEQNIIMGMLPFFHIFGAFGILSYGLLTGAKTIIVPTFSAEAFVTGIPKHKIMKGYLNNIKATNEMIRNGWAHTGDIGYYDEKEFFYIIDRTKDLIKYQGMQISPSEIETEIQKHPLVAECSVIGKPDDKYGELPFAFIIPKQEISADEIHKFLEDKLSSHKQLKGGIKFVDSLPKSETGKILRKKLREIII
ncbi:Luciferin 4-monooxygenase [Armadillidium nasatum]|uniref:Luciferin 4-monooxygenase n=1 Tax=Armadillidium nasatum TaxID=96803 RepID=A0A5N5SJ68_9CRUS|nr:Luciferin 4-monooxygenase [Armadillidium nasatum]